MSLIALVDPATLLGQGVREALGSRAAKHQIHLFSSDADEEGTLTEIGGEVALVHRLTRKSVEGVDLAILAGTAAQQATALDLLDRDSAIIVLANESDHPPGEAVVAGITIPSPTAGSVLVSPHPVVIALTHLLAPLRDLDPHRVLVTAVLPTSIHNEAGLDELFEQTRGILNFQGDVRHDVFPRQLAFNLLPGPRWDGLGEQTRSILGIETAVSIRLLQGAVFHGIAVSAHLELAGTSTVDALREALDSSQYIEVLDEGEATGPIDAAAREEMLVAGIEPSESSPGAFWLWAVMDNLTRGGASNAVEIADLLLQT